VKTDIREGEVYIYPKLGRNLFQVRHEGTKKCGGYINGKTVFLSLSNGPLLIFKGDPF
jgi:hypothetical protein